MAGRISSVEGPRRPNPGVYVAVVAAGFGLSTLVTYVAARGNNFVASILDAVFIVSGVGMIELWVRRRRDRASRARSPGRTVTFLFTDIQGSTRLLRQLGNRYAAVLDEHRRLIRESFQPGGGEEIDTQGDSFFVAFASSREALLAAVAAQRALANHPWPGGLRVAVRTGIHTGQALVVGDRYLGLSVHKAARVCAAGHGGQILVSDVTYQLALEDAEELDDVAVRDLGRASLRDLERPVHLFQVSARELDQGYPRLRGVETQPDRVPSSGRERELAEAAQAAISRRGHQPGE
jgi:class 3 adenylate cyclase